MVSGSHESAGRSRDRKTRKIKISDYERDVLIRTLEERLAQSTGHDAEVLAELLAQIKPKRSTTTERLRPVFQVTYADADSGEPRDCGHTHQSHLEANDCAQHLAAKGITGQVVPIVVSADGA